MKQVILNIPDNKYLAFINFVKSKFAGIQIKEKKSKSQKDIIKDDDTYEVMLLSEESLADDWLSDEDNRWDEVLYIMKHKKSDIVIISFPFSDLSKTNKRPALIISNDSVNNTGDYLMVQITSKIRNDNLSLPTNKSDFVNSTELPLQSCIRLHKIFLLNESLIISKYSAVNTSFLNSVIDKITRLLK